MNKAKYTQTHKCFKQKHQSALRNHLAVINIVRLEHTGRTKNSVVYSTCISAPSLAAAAVWISGAASPAITAQIHGKSKEKHQHFEKGNA